MHTVRTRAFLLFLAQLPRDPAAQMRRQEWLGNHEIGAAPRLLLRAGSGTPGNRVIADPAELRMLRAAIQGGQTLMQHAFDEFGIPEEALKALPDENAFLEARGKWLVEQEKAFIESFGLTVSESE